MRLCQILLLVFLLFPIGCHAGQANSTVVRIAGWTTNSERIAKIWVDLSSLDGRAKYTASGRDVELSVPAGEYVLEVAAPGFQSQRQILKAYQPAVFRTVALPVAWIHGQTMSSLTGTIRNYSGDVRNLRVKLMGLYGDQVWESNLDAKGSFRFPADAGAYLLLVIADLEKGIAVIDSRPLRIPFAKPLTVSIDLKGRLGMPIR